MPQGALSEGFELASEFGVPRAAGVPVDELRLAYTFQDYDRASRATWRFLRGATQAQVDSVHRGILEASNRLVTTSILARLFDPSQGLSPEGNAVYGLFNADGTHIPDFMGRSWDPAATSHYLTSGSATIDLSDVESLIRMVKLKGLTASGQRLLLLVNPSESETIASFRVGVESADLTRARYAFVPSGAAPARYVTERLEGAAPPEEYGGLPVIGSYGDALVIESMFVPSGYVAMVASGGPNSDRNVVGLREHPNPAYRGLRLIPGNQQRYPLVESFYAQSFGVGVRRRGAAAVMQLSPTRRTPRRPAKSGERDDRRRLPTTVHPGSARPRRDARPRRGRVLLGARAGSSGRCAIPGPRGLRHAHRSAYAQAHELTPPQTPGGATPKPAPSGAPGNTPLGARSPREGFQPSRGTTKDAGLFDLSRQRPSRNAGPSGPVDLSWPAAAGPALRPRPGSSHRGGVA
ncbi:hypothetical protein [Dietzia maris]|uniref:hypothetical protein n=1 Tax=Dietzia maris TaxID=37915 RepID=UPI00223B9284|nr:hypothetical protein [Dietzia maris]MCT1433261.1 hypothetical protein [Dietzia maris]MCT1520496.1 hypothetical protein [Dietzia maris]